MDVIQAFKNAKSFPPVSSRHLMQLSNKTDGFYDVEDPQGRFAKKYINVMFRGGEWNAGKLFVQAHLRHDFV